MNLKLPEGWDRASAVAEVRPSLDLATVLGDDHILTAKVRPGGGLTIVWISRLPPGGAGLPAGVRRPLLDVFLCPGRTPPAQYEIEGVEPGEIVGEDLRRIPARIEVSQVAIDGDGAACDVPVPTPLTARPYFWMGDAVARVGEVFRVPFYSMANTPHTSIHYFARWDPKVVRVVGVVKTRPESTIQAVFGNLDGDVPGGAKYHDIRGSYFKVYYCDPCDAVDTTSFFVAFFAGLHNFHNPGLPRPDLQPGYSPFPPLQVIHQFDLVLQVLPTAGQGETKLWLSDDEGGGIFPGDSNSDNTIGVIV